MTHRPLIPAAVTGLAAIALAACGGGSSTAVDVPTDPADSARVAAASQTASTHPDCAVSKIGPFYWEIGDANGARGGGPVGAGAPGAGSSFSIASASKWVYSAYVLQKVGVRQQDTPFLNFTSGYTEFVLPVCQVTDTVGSCLERNDGQDPATIGKFFYGSGHMQHHAAVAMGLGDMDSLELTAEVSRTLGDFGMLYSQPQLAGGLVGSASGYAMFLRRILRGELTIGASLGADKVCASPGNCSSAIASPVPDTERWNYSLGHWVEDDPSVGDHAFSSPGALGFYPWIDSTKTWYGILSRRSELVSESGQPGYNSAVCGRLIRQAWVTGVAVTSGPPTPAR